MTLFLTGALALMMLLALVYGFTGTMPRIHSRPLQGAALIVLGVAAIWVPLSFVAAALLVANGTRMVWLAACEKQPLVTDAEIGKARSRDLLPTNKWEVERAGRE